MENPPKSLKDSNLNKMFLEFLYKKMSLDVTDPKVAPSNVSASIPGSFGGSQPGHKNLPEFGLKDPHLKSYDSYDCCQRVILHNVDDLVGCVGIFSTNSNFEIV